MMLIRQLLISAKNKRWNGHHNLYEIRSSRFQKTKEQENEVIKKCIQKDADSIKNDACLDTNDSKTSELTGKININTATLDELKSLPGIGESKAQNIIKYRTEKGNFTDISKIKRSRGNRR